MVNRESSEIRNSLPEHSDGIPVDWSVHAKALLVFLALVSSFELALYAKTLLPLFILGVGLLWLGWGMWIIRRSRLSRHWPVSEGTIVENQTGVTEAMLERRMIYYFPLISYRYSVDGVEYVANKIVLFPRDLRIAGGGADSYADKHPHHADHVRARRLVEDFRAKFPLGSRAAVHYNPRSPREGFLITGALSRSWQHSIVFVVTGCFLVAVGAFIFYVEHWMS